MWLPDYVGQALENIAAAKLRAFLTALGIIIGIGAVITLLAISQGIRSSVVDAFSDLGANMVTVFPGAPTQPGESGGFGGGPGGFVASTLTVADAEALGALEGIRAAAPLISVPVMAVSEAGTLPAAATGTTSSLAEMASYELVGGRLFEAGASEAVLNESAAARLFPDGGAVGAQIRINQEPFTIVGVFKNEAPRLRRPGSGASNGDQPDGESTLQRRPALFIPVERALEINDTRYVSQIIIAAESPEAVDQVEARGREVLRGRHDGIQDFRYVSAQDLLEGFTRIFDMLTVGLAAIAGISLLVGGIGIMNIMLVSVTERTREIGLAKAVGATRGQVVVQFLVEAIILSLLGGVLGLALAWAGSLAVEEWLDVPTLITPASVLLAVGVSAAIGLFFGVAPAWRAARLDPIVALRHE